MRKRNHKPRSLDRSFSREDHNGVRNSRSRSEPQRVDTNSHVPSEIYSTAVDVPISRGYLSRGICGLPDFYSKLLGPTAEETFLVGFKTLLEMGFACDTDNEQDTSGRYSISSTRGEGSETYTDNEQDYLNTNDNNVPKVDDTFTDSFAESSPRISRHSAQYSRHGNNLEESSPRISMQSAQDSRHGKHLEESSPRISWQSSQDSRQVNMVNHENNLEQSSPRISMQSAQNSRQVSMLNHGKNLEESVTNSRKESKEVEYRENVINEKKRSSRELAGLKEIEERSNITVTKNSIEESYHSVTEVKSNTKEDPRKSVDSKVGSLLSKTVHQATAEEEKSKHSIQSVPTIHNEAKNHIEDTNSSKIIIKVSPEISSKEIKQQETVLENNDIQILSLHEKNHIQDTNSSKIIIKVSPETSSKEINHQENVVENNEIKIISPPERSSKDSTGSSPEVSISIVIEKSDPKRTSSTKITKDEIKNGKLEEIKEEPEEDNQASIIEHTKSILNKEETIEESNNYSKTIKQEKVIPEETKSRNLSTSNTTHKDSILSEEEVIKTNSKSSKILNSSTEVSEKVTLNGQEKTSIDESRTKVSEETTQEVVKESIAPKFQLGNQENSKSIVNNQNTNELNNTMSKETDNISVPNKVSTKYILEPLRDTMSTQSNEISKPAPRDTLKDRCKCHLEDFPEYNQQNVRKSLEIEHTKPRTTPQSERTITVEISKKSTVYSKVLNSQNVSQMSNALTPNIPEEDESEDKISGSYNASEGSRKSNVSWSSNQSQDLGSGKISSKLYPSDQSKVLEDISVKQTSRSFMKKSNEEISSIIMKEFDSRKRLDDSVSKEDERSESYYPSEGSRKSTVSWNSDQSPELGSKIKKSNQEKSSAISKESNSRKSFDDSVNKGDQRSESYNPSEDRDIKESYRSFTKKSNEERSSVISKESDSRKLFVDNMSKEDERSESYNPSNGSKKSSVSWNSDQSRELGSKILDDIDTKEPSRSFMKQSNEERSSAISKESNSRKSFDDSVNKGDQRSGSYNSRNSGNSEQSRELGSRILEDIEDQRSGSYNPSENSKKSAVSRSSHQSRELSSNILEDRDIKEPSRPFMKNSSGEKSSIISKDSNSRKVFDGSLKIRISEGTIEEVSEKSEKSNGRRSSEIIYKTDNNGESGNKDHSKSFISVKVSEQMVEEESEENNKSSKSVQNAKPENSQYSQLRGKYAEKSRSRNGQPKSSKSKMSNSKIRKTIVEVTEESDEASLSSKSDKSRRSKRSKISNLDKKSSPIIQLRKPATDKSSSTTSILKTSSSSSKSDTYTCTCNIPTGFNICQCGDARVKPVCCCPLQSQTKQMEKTIPIQCPYIKPCLKNNMSIADKICTCCTNSSANKNGIEERREKKLCFDCYTSTSSSMSSDSDPKRTKNGKRIYRKGQVRYAITKITEYGNFTTFEIMKSTRKVPKYMPTNLEGVFVLKRKMPCS